MRHTVPVEDLLLLLRPNAIIFVEEIEERTLGFFQGRVGSGLEVAQVGENAFFEFLRVLDGASEGLESEGKASNDIRAGDVEEIVPVYRSVGLFFLIAPRLRCNEPENTGNVVACGKEKPSDQLIGLPIHWRGEEEIFHCVNHPRLVEDTITGLVVGLTRHTIVHLLQSDLRVMRQALLRFIRQHKGLRLLRRRHRGAMLGIHFGTMTVVSPGDRRKERAQSIGQG